MYHSNISQKKVGMVVLISDKVDIKTIKLPGKMQTFHNDKGFSSSKHQSNPTEYAPKNRV